MKQISNEKNENNFKYTKNVLYLPPVKVEAFFQVYRKK